MVTKERNAENFTGVRVSTGIDVYLKQGDKEAISVEADILNADLSSAGDLNAYDLRVREAERQIFQYQAQETLTSMFQKK